MFKMMKQTTKILLVDIIAHISGINKKFHRYKEIAVNPQDKALISPVEGTVKIKTKNSTIEND